MSRRNARVRMARGGTKGERRECVPFYPGWPGVLPLVLSSPGLTPLSELNDLMRGRCSWVAPPPFPQRRLWGPALPSLLQRASFCLFCRLSSNSTGFCALVFISFFLSSALPLRGFIRTLRKVRSLVDELGRQHAAAAAAAAAVAAASKRRPKRDLFTLRVLRF